MSTETSTRIRFIPKKIGEGKAATWRVYDLQNGSFPYRNHELGEVLQDRPEPEIVAECERLSAEFGGVDEKKRGAHRSKPAATAADEADDDEAA